MSRNQAECEVRVYRANVERVRQAHPYGLGVAIESWVEVEVEAEILVPKKWCLDEIIQALKEDISIGHDCGTLRPDPITAEVVGIEGDKLVLKCPDWRIEFD